MAISESLFENVASGPKSGSRSSFQTGSERLRQEDGFTYLGAMFLVTLLGLALAGTGQAWSVASQREREAELIWAGNQFSRALQSYYQQSPGVAQYPERLEDLLEDKRFPTPRRHLRKLYPDPIRRSTEWGLIRTPDGRIIGVHSLSEDRPWKSANFPDRWSDFAGKQKYSEWHFVVRGGSALPGIPQSPATTPFVRADGR